MKKRSLKRALSLSLALLMILSLAACGKKSDPGTPSTPAPGASTSTPSDPGTAEPTYKERVVIGVANLLAKLDPASHNDQKNAWVTFSTHDTLISLDYDTNTFHPELAKEWTVSDDGLVYTFELEQGVKFHDGGDFTASDVVYTVNHAMESSYQAGKLKDITSVEATGDYSVKIVLNAPNSEFMRTLASAHLSIISEDAVSKDADQGYKIGTGPYVLTEWVPNDYVLLTRNEDFWGEQPKTKEFLYRQISEASARVIALQNGEIDICMTVPVIESAHVEEDEDCDLITVPTATLHYVGLNTQCDNPVLKNEKVRQAINYATNREDLVIAMTEGTGKIPHGVIPDNVWGYDPNVKDYTYDVEKAKALLAEAGYPNGITLSLTSNAASWSGAYEILQAQWAQAGIDLTLETDDAAVRKQIVADKSWEGIIISANFDTINATLRRLFYTGSSSNRPRFEDPYIDSVLDQALQESDEAKVLKMYSELGQYLVDRAGIVPLYIMQAYVGADKNVEGTVFRMDQYHDFSGVYVQQ